MMKDEGYSTFSMHYHTQLWKAKDAKNKKYNYGVKVLNNGIGTKIGLV